MRDHREQQHGRDEYELLKSVQCVRAGGAFRAWKLARLTLWDNLTYDDVSGKFLDYITAKDFGDQLVPNIASAKKNMRKSRAAAIRNRAQRSALRTALKRASSAGNADDKLAAVKLLDRAARKGLIHKNAAARHKSRLAKTAK
jgi:small subunit ribosomal protein S20